LERPNLFPMTQVDVPYKTLRDVELQGKLLFIRVDFNVPTDDQGNITDDIRIRAALPTISYALDHGAKIVMASHRGRPKGRWIPELSMALVKKRVERLLKREISFVDACVGEKVDDAKANLKEGDILLLENLRFYKEETDNDPVFAAELAKGVDVYVNDAFGTAHRKHASTYGIALHVDVRVMGLLMEKEISYFRKALVEPARPLAILLGGVKVSTKLGLIENLLKKADKVLIGGAMAFTFLKAMGYPTGASIVEEDMLGVANEILAEAKNRGVALYLPVDFVITEEIDFAAPARIVPYQEVPHGWKGVDIGPATIKLYEESLNNARTIVWNGPMGIFEMNRFKKGTVAMAKCLASSSALTIAGGGDTDVAIHKAGFTENFSYISTGGGAFLELM
jgi:phosphoglycerate kinase